uniref:Uncharacterized protein n=1 Tax=Udotea sp. TZ0819 TaxID=2364085 RepID=A0A386B207_9CHLO|nr:hypothetical protein [Udotea sp. TZ0819]
MFMLKYYRLIRFLVDSRYRDKLVFRPAQINNLVDRRLNFYFYRYWIACPYAQKRCEEYDIHPVLVYHYFRLKLLAPERLEFLKQFSSFQLDFTPILRHYESTTEGFSMKFSLDEYENRFILAVSDYNILVQKKFLFPSESGFEDALKSQKKSYLQRSPENESEIQNHFLELKNEICQLCNDLENEFRIYDRLENSSNYSASSSPRQYVSEEIEPIASSSSQPQINNETSSTLQERESERTYSVVENINRFPPSGGGKNILIHCGWGLLAAGCAYVVWRLVVCISNRVYRVFYCIKLYYQSELSEIYQIYYL